MENAAKRRMTAREYLAAERKAVAKSEFVNGEMFAMAGGTRRHSRICVNTIAALSRRLEGTPCQVFNSDMRVRVEATGLYTYPDAHVACGKLAFEDEREDTLLNPTVIVEVLSESTAAWNRGGKFRHYRQIESLTDYVLIAQDAWVAEHYTRRAGGIWMLQTLDGARAALALRSTGTRLPLREVFSNTGLKPGAIPSVPNLNPSPKR